MAYMNQVEHNLIEPFDTDDGCLKGLTPEYVFALGVEWEQFRQQLKDGKPFTTLCLPENASRLTRMAERHKRFVEDRPTAHRGWAEIFVGDYLV